MSTAATARRGGSEPTGSAATPAGSAAHGTSGVSDRPGAGGAGRSPGSGRLRHSHRGPLLLALALALIPLMALSVAVGSRPVDLATVVDALRAFDPGDNDHLVVRELRVPRTILAVLTGGCLGVAGALMQSLTRNTLAEPGTLGVNAGAALGVVVGLALTGSASITVYVWFAFAGAGLASVLVHRLGRAGEAGVNPVRLVLAGAGLSMTLGALTDILILSSPQQILDSFRNWATGSLQGRGWESLPVVAVCLAVGLALALSLSGPLNSVSLGTDLARALGVDVRRTWGWTNLAIMVLAGGATAAIGPVSFVGLAAPHAARSIVGPDHRWVVPYSCVLASMAVLIADLLGRLVLHPGEIGAGIMTALIGAPFFIALVRRGRVSEL
ncbi:FecCD family ABC transporter permease [Schaalia naturae]|uniref:FecCD family ABC transporter permease n=1 Tax=Schaalia naturae TaxID=635203 RepID=A0ABW2SJK0_9ACTO